MEQKRREDEATHVGEVGEELIDDGEREVPTTEVMHRQQRMLRPVLGAHEQREQQRSSDEAGQDRRTRPAQHRTAVERDEQEPDAECELGGPGDVEGLTLTATSVRQHEEPENKARQSNGCLQDEDPTPAECVDKGATDDHTEHGRARADHRPVAHGLRPSLGSETPIDHRKCRRAGGSTERSAQESEGDERWSIPGHDGSRGKHRDPSEAEQVHLPGSETIGELSADGTEHRHGQTRSGDRPGQDISTRTEVLGDVTERDGEHRDGEAGGEHPAQPSGEDDPGSTRASLHPTSDPSAQHEAPGKNDSFLTTRFKSDLEFIDGRTVTGVDALRLLVDGRHEGRAYLSACDEQHRRAGPHRSSDRRVRTADPTGG